MKFMQIKPQKARGKLLESMWTDPDWVAEEKYDGDRRIAQFIGGIVRFTGTRESVDGTGYVEKSANIPHLSCDWQGPMTATEIKMSHEPARHSPRKLDGTVLDGEIVAPFAKDLPGGKSKYVTSIMGSSPEEAIRKQREHGWLEYMVFDCLWWKGGDQRNKPLAERHEILKYALAEWKNPYAKLTQHLAHPVAGKNKKILFDEVLRMGGEGVILKNKHHTYGDERLWVKVKGEWTADVVILGFEPGKGKYKGTVGAIVFGQYKVQAHAHAYKQNGVCCLKATKLIRMGTCSGFDDKLRGMLDGDYVSDVIEIGHNGREPTGAFRHPRFKRFRPDKSPKDCVYREDET